MKEDQTVSKGRLRGTSCSIYSEGINGTRAPFCYAISPFGRKAIRALALSRPLDNKLIRTDEECSSVSFGNTGTNWTSKLGFCSKRA
jgi:hypothetical protein